MAGKSDGGLTEALQLDQAARDLANARAGGAENPADPAPSSSACFPAPASSAGSSIREASNIAPAGRGGRGVQAASPATW
jgi:hypothetical protein